MSDAIFHTTSNDAKGVLNPLEPSVCYILYTAKFNTKNSTLYPHSGVMSSQENIWALRLNWAIVRRENKKQKRKRNNNNNNKKKKNEEEVEKYMYSILFSPYVCIISLYIIRQLVFLMEMICVFRDVGTEFLRTI